MSGMFLIQLHNGVVSRVDQQSASSIGYNKHAEVIKSEMLEPAVTDGTASRMFVFSAKKTLRIVTLLERQIMM